MAKKKKNIFYNSISIIKLFKTFSKFFLDSYQLCIHKRKWRFNKIIFLAPYNSFTISKTYPYKEKSLKYYLKYVIVIKSC